MTSGWRRANEPAQHYIQSFKEDKNIDYLLKNMTSCFSRIQKLLRHFDLSPTSKLLRYNNNKLIDISIDDDNLIRKYANRDDQKIYHQLVVIDHP